MMIRVKFLKSHKNFSYFAGDNAEIDEKKAAELLKKGFIIIVPSEKEENTLPDKLPARAVLWKQGFKSIDDLKLLTADDFSAINGISKKMAENIVNWIAENKKVDK